MKHLFILIVCSLMMLNVNAQQELIVNGSFENDFWPSKQPGTDVYAAKAYSEPLRVIDYFDEYTQGTYPTMGTAPHETYQTGTGIWFLLNPTGWYYARSYVDADSDTSVGSKCLTLRYVGYNGAADRSDHAYTPYKHVIFQRVTLDNSQKYALKFKFKKKDLLPGPTNSIVENKVSRFVVGIIASNQVGARDYSYTIDVEIPFSGDELWKDGEVEFDLPAILAEKPTLDFSSCAILFGMQTTAGAPHPTSGFLSVQSAQISIDGVSLKEKTPSSINEIGISKQFNIIDRQLKLLEPVKSLKVFDMLGSTLYETNNINANQLAFTFEIPGVYLIKVDNMTKKVHVK